MNRMPVDIDGKNFTVRDRLSGVVYSAIIVMTMFTNVAIGQQPLYTSESFTIYPTKVVQGTFEASADSTGRIVSNYASPATAPERKAEPVSPIVSEWHATKDMSAYPRYRSSQMIVDALATKALEEVLLDIRPDGAFMAGAKWEGIWTRDISYSIVLSLAFINPEAAKISLKAKVKNDRIIQDTGTGGSWPVSTDRMIWTLAAWEIYLVTGDREWLEYAYTVAKNSAADDMQNTIDPATGLCRGESSFLDWREQTYPRWMDPKDIYHSQALGTNAVHYRAFQILASMASLCGDDSAVYSVRAEKIKTGMNRLLWLEEKGYYGQYLYGRTFQTLSPKSEALGEALSVLFGIADSARGARVIASMPTVEFGTPVIYPQIPNIPPYHNDSVWPFVEAFRTWASARTDNSASVEHGLASIYRAAALFNTNKENLTASTGDYAGTRINSDRQLWSAAGCLATIYRVFFGMTFAEDGLSLTPYIPAAYTGDKSITNFKYRNAVLTIRLRGTGSSIASVTMDSVQIPRAFIPGNTAGNHIIEIDLDGAPLRQAAINKVKNAYAPETPVVNIEGGTLRWKPVPGAAGYRVYINGRNVDSRKGTSNAFAPRTGVAEAQVLAVDARGYESFLSAPVEIGNRKGVLVSYAASAGMPLKKVWKGYTAKGYIRIAPDENRDVVFSINAPRAGKYRIDVRYANGNGPVNTDNKCALRMFYLNDIPVGPIVMPQRGAQQWDHWGYSSFIIGRLKKGYNTCRLSFTPFDNNMNIDENSAFIDCLRAAPLPVK